MSGAARCPGAAKAVAVSEAGGQPLYASAFTVGTEDYALSRRLYLYLPVQAPSPAAVDFVSFGAVLPTKSFFTEVRNLPMNVQILILEMIHLPGQVEHLRAQRCDQVDPS